MPYEEGLRTVDAGLRARIPRARGLPGAGRGLSARARQPSATLRGADPDVTIIISDDQDEWFFEDNMPALAVYWGETVPLPPAVGCRRACPEVAEGDRARLRRRGDGRAGRQRFGRYLIEYLIEHDFDVAHIRTSAALRRSGPAALSDAGTARSRTCANAAARAGPAARLLLHRQASLRQPAAPDPAGLPEHVLPAEPADAPALRSDGRGHRRRGAGLERAGQRRHRRVGRPEPLRGRRGAGPRLLGALEQNDAKALQAIPAPRAPVLGGVRIAELGRARRRDARHQLKMELLAYVPVYRTPAGDRRRLGLRPLAVRPG